MLPSQKLHAHLRHVLSRFFSQLVDNPCKSPVADMTHVPAATILAGVGLPEIIDDVFLNLFGVFEV